MFALSLERSFDRNGELIDLDVLARQKRRDFIRNILEDCTLILSSLTIMFYSAQLIKVSFYV